jgi:hypothetical protein
MGLPIHAIGIGEGMDDLRPFDAPSGTRDCRSERMNPETQAAPTAPAPAGSRAGARLAIDIGPLLLFFMTYFLTPGPDILRVITATAVFMVAMIVAMLVSQSLPADLAAAVVLGDHGARLRRAHHLVPRRKLHQDQADPLLLPVAASCSFGW